jgi:aminoglycoside phosphotransferase (APT) family kinase protein
VALAAVPGASDAARHGVLRFVALEGGVANRTWRVSTGAGEFALRVSLAAAAAAALGVDRARELLLHDAAAGAGLAPRIVARDARHRFLVTEFAAGGAWPAARMRDAVQLQRLGRTLAALHSLPLPGLLAVSLLDSLRAQARAMRRDPALDALLEGAEHDFAQATASPRAACIVHSDAHHGNIVEGSALLLVDWEYAHVGDPLEDLASIVASEPQVLQAATREQLLEWFALRDRADASMLDAMVRLFTALNELWQRRAVALAARGA